MEPHRSGASRAGRLRALSARSKAHASPSTARLRRRDSVDEESRESESTARAFIDANQSSSAFPTAASRIDSRGIRREDLDGCSATSPGRASKLAFGSYAPARRSRGDPDARDTREETESDAAAHGEWHRERVDDERPLRSQGGLRSNRSWLRSPTRGDRRDRRSHFHTSECSSETLLRRRRSVVLVASPSEDLSFDTRAHVFPVTRLQNSGINRGAAPLDLSRPCGVDVGLGARVEALEQSCGNPGPLVLGKAECLFEQGGGINHGARSVAHAMRRRSRAGSRDRRAVAR
jgi:hypothetical protein